MVKKPGAFRRYRYRDALFPTATFRQAWEELDATLATWSAAMNYLQVLKLARDAGQAQVEAESRRFSMPECCPDSTMSWSVWSGSKRRCRRWRLPR